VVWAGGLRAAMRLRGLAPSSGVGKDSTERVGAEQAGPQNVEGTTKTARMPAVPGAGRDACPWGR